MKKVLLIGILFRAVLLHGSTVSYTVDSTTDFSNPERGWYPTMYYYGPGSSSNEMVNSTNFNNDISSSSNYSGDTNITLIKRIYDFGGLNGATSYQNSALPAQVLTDITSDFSNARSMGVKLILRFDYNEGPIGAADASQSIILGHLAQLQPLFAANEDVIAYMEAGFIGTWGEWHDSTNGLTDPNNNNSTTAESTILSTILSDLPSDRMVAIRYPGFTLEIFNTTSPVSAANAFNGSNYSRCGTHDDCFENDQYDSGTYQKGTSLGWTVAQFKTYLGQQNYSVEEGGESCGTSSYSSCSNSMADLQSLHWSALHFQYDPGVIQGWGTGGCLNPIDLGLGYRYALLNATLPATVNQGGTLSMSFQVANNGYANCYNPRNLEVVLRPVGQSGTGTVIYLTPTSSEGTDPRFWQPGTTTTANVNVTLPGTLAAGSYNVLLDLSDPKASLNGTPAYSIRLADSGVWESSTGYNNLGATITISSCPGCTYSPTMTPTPAVTGTVISVNFVGGSTTNGTPPNMASTEVAGLKAVENWNNADSYTGSLSALNDNNGVPTTAACSWDAPGGLWSLPITASPGNNDMMMGYLDAEPSENTTLTISALPSLYTANGYSVYAYFDGDNGSASRQASFTIGGTTLTGTDAASTNFSGSFAQAVGGGNGNYVLFTNLTYTSFTLTVAAGSSTDAYPRGPLNGIQIVCNGSSASPTLTLTPSPSKSATPSSSPTASPSASLTASSSASASPSPTASRTNSPTLSASPTPSRTSSSTPSVSASPSLSASSSLTPSMTLTTTSSPSPSKTLSPSPLPSATETLSVSPSLSASPSITITASPNSSATRTATQSPSPSSSATGSATRSSTATPSESASPSTTLSPSLSATLSSSPSPSYSATSGPSGSPSPDFSPTPSTTRSASSTPSMTSSVTSTLSASPSLSPSLSPSPFLSATLSPSRSPSPTASISATPSPSSSGTLSPTFGSSPTDTATSSPSPSVTLSQSPNPNPSPSVVASPSTTPSQSPSTTESPSSSASPSPSLTLTRSPSPNPSSSQSSTASATLTATPTNSPSTTPTVTATESPSVSVSRTSSASPSASPTRSSVASASPSPSATLSPTPSVLPSVTATLIPRLDPPPSRPAGGNAVPPQVVEIMPVPNPQSGPNFMFAIELTAPANHVSLRVFSRAMALIGEFSLDGAWNSGWGKLYLSLPGLSNGLYFVQAKGDGDRGYQAKTGDLMVIH